MPCRHITIQLIHDIVTSFPNPPESEYVYTSRYRISTTPNVTNASQTYTHPWRLADNMIIGGLKAQATSRDDQDPDPELAAWAWLPIRDTVAPSSQLHSMSVALEQCDEERATPQARPEAESWHIRVYVLPLRYRRGHRGLDDQTQSMSH